MEEYKCNRLLTREASGTKTLEKTKLLRKKVAGPDASVRHPHCARHCAVSACDKDSYILSFGTQVTILTKIGIFQKSSLQAGPMRKFAFLNSFLLSLTLCQNPC